MKKILVLGLFLVVVASAIAAISAANEELTLEGIHFNIPDGYKAVEQQLEANETDDDTGAIEKQDIDGITVDTEVTSKFKNSAGDELELEIGIQDGKKIDKINPTGAEAKKIADKDGFLIKGTDDGKDKYEFFYIEDGKLVKITAVSDDIISQVIS